MQQVLIMAFIFSMAPVTLSSEPTWSSYDRDVMFSGEHRTFSSLTQPSATPYSFTNQIYFVATGQPYHVFATTPKVILSLMGYQQSAPTNTDTFVGFSVQIQNVTINDFDVVYYVYGASMAYLSYMYLATTSNDFYTSYHPLTLDQTASSRKYSFQVSNNPSENYTDFGKNKITMKGFLAGYKMKQGSAVGFSLNFTLTPLNGTHFNITVQTHDASTIESIWYFRIGYDQTAIERRDSTSVFRDSLFYELKNGVSTNDLSSLGFRIDNSGDAPVFIGFNYRNYLMGTNKINFSGAGPQVIEFYLYYAFFSQKAANYPAEQFIQTLSGAQYLYADIFHHAIQACTTVGQFYDPKTDWCETTCSERYVADEPSKTCLSCHFSCLSCTAKYEANACATCDPTLRTLNASSNTCVCLPPKVDNGKDLFCLSQSPQTCLKFNANNQCIVCNTNQLIAFDGTCITKIQFCANYNMNTKKCTRCISTHQFRGQSCVLIPKNNTNAPGNQQKPQAIKCKDDQYLDSTGKCIKIGDPNCRTYNNVGVCVECRGNFVINFETNRCIERKEKNFTKCAEDEKGSKWVIIEDKCIKIDLNCASDGFQASGCFKCREGFFLLDTVCYHIPGSNAVVSESEKVQETGVVGGSVLLPNEEEYFFDEALGLFVRRT